jgi:carbonic anhydrase
VEVLKVQHIIIVGHRDCGGVKAAMTRQSFGTTIDAYVRHVRDTYRTHISEVDALEDQQVELFNHLQLKPSVSLEILQA